MYFAGTFCITLYISLCIPSFVVNISLAYLLPLFYNCPQWKLLHAIAVAAIVASPCQGCSCCQSRHMHRSVSRTPCRAGRRSRMDTPEPRAPTTGGQMDEQFSSLIQGPESVGEIPSPHSAVQHENETLISSQPSMAARWDGSRLAPTPPRARRLVPMSCSHAAREQEGMSGPGGDSGSSGDCALCCEYFDASSPA